MSVRAVYFNVQDVGKHVKKSKRRFIWKFQINSREHCLEMFVSYLSGKKSILLDGNQIYEAQKVTSSFQYGFTCDDHTCSIVQHGDQFELRINNQVFSHLYNQERMRREFQVEGGESSNQDKANKNRFNDYGSDDDEYKKKSSFPKKSEFEFEPRQKATSFRVNVNEGFDKEKKAGFNFEKDNKPQSDNADEGLGFSSAFQKFDFKGGQSKPNANADPFNDFNSKFSEDSKARSKTSQLQATDFGFGETEQKPGFSSFEAFETKPKSTNVGGFDNFGAFDQPAKPKEEKPAAPNLLELDLFGGDSNQPSQSASNVQNANVVDFFGQSTQPVSNNQPAPVNTFDQNFGGQGFGGFPQNSTNQPPANTGLGFDFGAANTNTVNNSFSTANTSTAQPQLSNIGGFDLGQVPVTQSVTTTQPQANKGGLWSSDLVSLSSNDLMGTASNNNNNLGGMGGNAFDNLGSGLQSNNQNFGMGGFGNQNTGSGFNNYNTSQGFGGNQNFSAGVNQGFNTGYGGNMGGMNTNNYGMGGLTTGMGNMSMNNNQNFGYQQTQATPVTNTNDVKTPFDF